MGAPQLCRDVAIDTLTRLVSRSMVQVEPRDGGGSRFRVLEPLRQLGEARLREHGDLETVRRAACRAHAQYG